MSPLAVAFTTVATLEEAGALAELAVSRGLAACVQMEPIHSVYRWRGGVHRGAEVRLLFKTTRDACAALQAAVLAAHPYAAPTFHVLGVDAASPGTVDWVLESVHSASPGGAGADDHSGSG